MYNCLKYIEILCPSFEKLAGHVVIENSSMLGKISLQLRVMEAGTGVFERDSYESDLPGGLTPRFLILQPPGMPGKVTGFMERVEGWR
jgi:hypothetical protein